MGGEENDAARREWDIHPERPAILIGTQDMLLSRALNRGYGMARARWPMHFGLLNNDALWILDETQLMGAGVRTSAQLEGLRAKLGLAASSFTWWASATLDRRLLQTPDHPTPPRTLALDGADAGNAELARRVGAVKKIASLPLSLTADSKEIVTRHLGQLAEEVLAKHQTDTLTIVILNRVNRARELYENLLKLGKKQALPELLLVHSRFRPMERAQLSRAIQRDGEKIIIATQAIEAGVDISARTLITEIAPWSSLVQRFGRCNRKGEYNATGGADIFWINIEAADARNANALALPYLPDPLATARKRLAQLNGDAAPAELGKIATDDDPLAESSILRRKDLVELFDTTPDLSGLDLDIGRYIRDGEERDVQVFWRKLPNQEKSAKKIPTDTIQPQRDELVRVPTHEFGKFAGKKENKGAIWKWDALDGAWQEFRDTWRVAPGQIYLIDTDCGGYSEKLGWTGEKAREAFRVFEETTQAKPAPRDGQHDDESQTQFQSIEEHTAAVVSALEDKLEKLPAAKPWAAHLTTAALWHDIGKAHPAFQKFLGTDHDIPADYADKFLAKSTWKPGIKNERPHFRHELASALAWLQTGPGNDTFTQNLVAYLIAAHHGKVRLSIRAMPGEIAPTNNTDLATPTPAKDRLYARGIWDNDWLFNDPDKQLVLENIPTAPLRLDLTPMQMGDTPDKNNTPRASWTSRILSLRDAPTLGIFRLAWLETLLRAADAEGSKK
jgi:CRISPR-associated endonuclease/helicase Cas3